MFSLEYPNGVRIHLMGSQSDIDPLLWIDLTDKTIKKMYWICNELLLLNILLSSKEIFVLLVFLFFDYKK